ncbi:hypothetical protein D9758_015001 [Tetrapyrgos nigripes]|uniref:KOW domain-containing protein n=1 Tax=Tetrapyrgos nigripes TaxID=182062 RepID=A0A8H5CE81_9AGAR|nr:hypothetical protein D9758_015001 [Tetrapyrgos nigripes]
MLKVTPMSQVMHSGASSHRQGQFSQKAKRKRIESFLDIEAGESDEKDMRPIKRKGKARARDSFLDDGSRYSQSEDTLDNLGDGQNAPVDSDDDEEDVYDDADDSQAELEDIDDEDYLDTFADNQYDELVQRLGRSCLVYDESEHHHNLDFPSSVRSTVMSIDTQHSFWQLKCKHGQESNLVFNIMCFAMEREDANLGLEYIESTPGPSEPLMPPSTAWDNKHLSYSYLRTPSSIPTHRDHVTSDDTFFTTSKPALSPAKSFISSAPPPLSTTSSQFNLPGSEGQNSLSPWIRKALKATKDIEEFAMSSDGNNGRFADQLAMDLGLPSLPPLWLHVIDSTGLDPNESPDDGRNQYLQEHCPQLLEWIVSQDATATLSALTEWLSLEKSTTPPLSIPLASATALELDSSVTASSILQGRASHLVYHAKILSAFAVAGLSGYICLEADLGKSLQETDVVVFLRSHAAVPISTSVKQRHDAGVSRAWVHMHQLTKNQVAELLSWRPPDIRLGKWVRITKGIYSGDLATVVRRETHGGQRRLQVLTIPRVVPPISADWNVSVQPSHTAIENTHRPPQRLFSIVDFPGAKRILTEAERNEDTEDEMDESETRVDRLARLKKEEWTKKLACHHFLWEEDQFHFRLLQITIPYSSVSQLDITMDERSHIMFVMSGHPYLSQVEFPDPQEWVFFANDKIGHGTTSVEILPPLERILRKGTVQSVESQGCWVHFTEYDGFDEGKTAVFIPNGNLLKTFRIGDLVQVEGGRHKGLRGWVVSHSDIQVKMILWHKPPNVPDGKEVKVHPNTCQLQSPRAEFTVLWINTHVLVIAGKKYRHYTGFVVDVSMSRNGNTMVHVDIPMAGVTAVLHHDNDVEHISKRPLRQRFPLQAHEMQFRQLSWTDNSTEYIVSDLHTEGSYLNKLELLPRAPNPNVPLDQDGQEKPLYDKHSGELLTLEKCLLYQPPKCPWIGKQNVSVVKGLMRSLGTVKDVRRDHHRPSRLTIVVELYMIRIERGGNPCIEVDYTWVRDHHTGLSLWNRFPLRGNQAYWEPLVDAHPVKPSSSVNTQNTVPPLLPAFELGKTPPWTGGESAAEATTASTSTSCTHWAVDRRLHSKEFFARWIPSKGLGEPKVVAKPNSLTGLKNRDALLVVHGEHTGKYLWPFYHDFIDVEGEKEQQPAIMAVEFHDWGEDIENQVEGFVLVRPEEYAKAAGDVNREQFKGEIKRLHDEAQAHNKRPRPKVLEV